MTIRRLIAFVASAGLILALAACGGGGSKNSATKTATSKTPRSTVTGTITPKTTATGKETPGAATLISQDGGQGTPPAGQATQSSATAVRPTPITGTQATFRVQYTVASDPANIQRLVEQHSRLPSRLTVTTGQGVLSISIERPFIKVTGTIDGSGNFIATGQGSVEPYENVEATFQGTISNGQLTGTYAIGTNGALPGGQPITYNVTGTNQQAQTPPG